MVKEKKKSKTSPRAMKTAENKVAVANLRRQGFTFRQVGQAIGISHARAIQIQQENFRELHESGQIETGAYVFEQNEKLDEMERDIRAAIKNGEITAVEAIPLRRGIMQDQARLNGLYAPVKQEVTGKDGGPVTSGVLVVPAGMTLEEWKEKYAKKGEGE